MQFKDLINYRNTLYRIISTNRDSLDYQKIERPIFQELENFNASVNLENIEIDNLKESMHNTQREILKNITDLYTYLNRFILELDQMILNLEKTYHEKSIEIQKADLVQPPEHKNFQADYHELFFTPPISGEEPSEIEKQFVGTIKKYVNFKWPGLEIGPSKGYYTKELVALDPLYLADNVEGRFIETKKLWNKMYQKRLRYYTFNDNTDNPMHQLPKSQFGLILSFNWFNFKTQDVIEKYIKSAFELLKPGGAMVFTYNNCSFPKAIDKVDEMHYTYTNGYTLKEFCKTTGYEIVSSYDGENQFTNWCVSWLEIRKPGKLTSLRGGQNLGAINRLWNGENE